ncbi:MAG TPA: glycosyltransferase family A protein [Gemmatimonadaceae bacterium]|nr:glycosyltransferase family A protein [Gemmatimonadaceae bacterium]
MKPPRVSIIIPAYESSSTIADCLRGLKAQTFRDFEVIVVNSSQERETRRILDSEFPDAIFEQVDHRLLPHAARNVGASRARGEVLVFSDPDCRAHPDWLERLVAAHDSGHALVCGAIEMNDDARWFERGVHLCKYSFRLSGLTPGKTWVAGTANACCSRELWNAIGPFDGDHFSGDAQFSWAAASRGHVPWFEPRAVVVHRYIGSMSDLLTERFSRGADFATARMYFDGWSRPRALGHFVAFPLALALVIGRGLRDAVVVGGFGSFLATLPMQIAGHTAWLVGEERAYLSYSGRKSSKATIRLPDIALLAGDARSEIASSHSSSSRFDDRR